MDRSPHLGPEHCRPDYAGNGFLNLVASLVAARGGEPRHAGLGALPAAELADVCNVVFLIVDGLGDNYLRGAGGALADARRCAISAVFPSTTACAITTSYTGLSPLEHGLTGWHTYFGEAACVGAPLPFTIRGGERTLGARGLGPRDLYRGGGYMDGMDARTLVVSWDAILESDYNRHHCGGARRIGYSNLEGLVTGIETAVKSGPDRKFIYAYWWEFDRIAHRFGVGSPQALAHFRQVDAAFASLMQRLAGTGTAVVASADHGFVDSAADEMLSIEDAPGLPGLLRYPLCGERRIAWCYVQPGREAEFAARAAEWLGERADVRPSRDLLDDGWLGPGDPHPRIGERIGDVAIVMRGRNTLKDWVAGEPRFLHIGNHGGTSADEMLIPLILART